MRYKKFKKLHLKWLKAFQFKDDFRSTQKKSFIFLHSSSIETLMVNKFPHPTQKIMFNFPPSLLHPDSSDKRISSSFRITENITDQGCQANKLNFGFIL